MRKYGLIFCLLIVLQGYCKSDGSSFVNFSGYIDYLKDSAEVTAVLYKYGPDLRIQSFQSIYKAKISNHSFNLDIPAPVAGSRTSVTLLLTDLRTWANTQFLDPCPVYSTDEININYKDGVALFSGKGAERYNAQFQLLAIRGLIRGTYISDTSLQSIYRELQLADTIQNAQLQYLASIKNTLAAKEYNIFRSDIITGAELVKMNDISFFADSREKIDRLTKLWATYRKSDRHEQLLKSIDPSISNWHIRYVLEKYKFDSLLYYKKKNVDSAPLARYIIKNYSGKSRELLLVEILYAYRYREDKNHTYGTLVRTVPSYLKDEYLIAYATRLKNFLVEGVKSYDFALKSFDGTIKKLSDYKGQVVLLDFWKSECGPCRALHPILDSIQALFDKNKFRVISIYAGSDSTLWDKEISSGLYTSLENVNLMTDYDESPTLDHYQVNAYPTIILIDKMGRLCRRPTHPGTDNGADLVGLIKVEIRK